MKRPWPASPRSHGWRVAVAGATLLAGCAAPVARHVPPEGSARSSIALAALVDAEAQLFASGTTSVTAFEPRTCAPHAHGLFLKTIADTRAEAASPAGLTYAELAAGEPVVLTFNRRTRGGLGRSDCTSAIEFTPQPELSYKAIYRIEAGWCRVALYQRSGVNEAWVHQAASSGRICLDDTTKARLIDDY